MNERKQKTKHPLIEVRSHFVQNKKNEYIFISIFIFALFAVLYLTSRVNFLLLHIFTDMITIFIAVAVFVIIWSGRHLLDNHYYLCVGTGFLFFAIFDFLDMLGAKGMGVFPQFGDLGPTLYLISRYILSITFLLAPFFIKRKVRFTVLFTVYSLISILLLLSVFYWKNFPVTYIEGTGLTPFKISSDYLINFLLLAAIGLLLHNRRAFDPNVMKNTLFSLILSIGTGFLFTLYSNPLDTMNTVGHFFQIASFYLIFKTFVETGLARPQNLLFRNLTQNNEERAAELVIANRELRFQNSEKEKRAIELFKANKELVIQKEEIEELNEHLEDRVIERTAQLESANKELESLSYSISHDLKAPLRHIIGYDALLVKKYLNLLPEEGQRYLENISNATTNMGELIDELLRFSKTGIIEMQQRVLNMNDIVDAYIQPILEADVEHRIVFNIASMPLAFGDLEMIKSVWSNLIDNAVKYSRKKELAEITIDAEQTENETIYHIKDNGAGFDMSQASKLFAVFQRLHSREDYEGTGIGLATVQKVVTRHGGRIWAESKLGEGASFYFTLMERKQGA